MFTVLQLTCPYWENSFPWTMFTVLQLTQPYWENSFPWTMFTVLQLTQPQQKNSFPWNIFWDTCLLHYHLLVPTFPWHIYFSSQTTFLSSSRKTAFRDTLFYHLLSTNGETTLNNTFIFSSLAWPWWGKGCNDTCLLLYHLQNHNSNRKQVLKERRSWHFWVTLLSKSNNGQGSDCLS